MFASLLLLTLSPCSLALHLHPTTAIPSALRFPASFHRKTAIFNSATGVEQELVNLKTEIRALKFCLANSDAATASEDTRANVLAYGFDDKRFLRSQLTLVREELLLHMKGLPKESRKQEEGERITVSNWSSVMKKSHIKGPFDIDVSFTGPSTVMQLSKHGEEQNANAVFDDADVLSGAFTLSFGFKISSSSKADSLYAFFGTSKLPASEFPVGNHGDGIIVALSIYDKTPNGIYLIKTTSGGGIQRLASSTRFHASGDWEDLVITHSASAVDTWQIEHKGETVIKYSDPNYKAVAAVKSASHISAAKTFWGIGSRTGDKSGDFSIRSVSLKTNAAIVSADADEENDDDCDDEEEEEEEEEEESDNHDED